MNRGARRITRSVSLQHYTVEREADPRPTPPSAHRSFQMVLREVQDRMILNILTVTSMMGLTFDEIDRMTLSMPLTIGYIEKQTMVERCRPRCLLEEVQK